MKLVSENKLDTRETTMVGKVEPRIPHVQLWYSQSYKQSSESAKYRKANNNQELNELNGKKLGIHCSV